MTEREALLEAALKKSLSIIQFSLANLDGSTKGWPEATIRQLGELVASDTGLPPLEREIGTALQIWAAPVIYLPTVQRPAKKKASTRPSVKPNKARRA